jgi:hypothetical protein
VAIAEPTIIQGTNWPKTVVIPPLRIVQTLIERMMPRFLVPDAEGETPETDWKYIER